MADKVKVRFDAEADYLEVRVSDAAGYMKETKNDALMERVDAQGHIIGCRLRLRSGDSTLRGAQAASLSFSAACRKALRNYSMISWSGHR